jgi:ATP-binding cassette, subfamily B, bacterial
MKYHLKTTEDEALNPSFFGAAKKMFSLMKEEKKYLFIALAAILVNSLLNLVGPLLTGYTIDKYVIPKDYPGVLTFTFILLGIYLLAVVANYIQVRVMGAVGQRTLWRLRNKIFVKLQELPLSFFNQNKAGDLISRVNNDTDKLNQFFSQTLMQFTGNAFIIIGSAIFIISINWKLGLASLAPAIFLILMTQLVSNVVKNSNLKSLQAQGNLSAEVQESMDNFKVIVAFNRRDYFKKKFADANEKNYKSSLWAGFFNNLFGPVFDFAGNIAQLIVLAYGVYLILQGQFAIGLLISFLLYVGRFYDPLRSFASFWPTMQIALAGWDRISEITQLESDLMTVEGKEVKRENSIMRFENVSFHYENEEGEKVRDVLREVNFLMEKGKTYALVGPTGGGKTTTASLIARLFDPSSGTIYLGNKDIRSYTGEERTKMIGFILQEPFLFSGTVKDNILYGNPDYENLTEEQLVLLLQKEGLEDLLNRFEGGLKASVDGSSLSLGQRQLIAFMRIVLRKPELLILDEATANIDTITEELLETILKKLPKETTKIIIAHRLNTIRSADEIFFVNGGEVKAAGSMEHAVGMLLHHKRES